MKKKIRKQTITGIKNIKNDIFKKIQNSYCPKNNPKLKIKKTLKSHVRKPQVKKGQKTNYNHKFKKYLEWQYKIIKSSKITPKHPRRKNKKT